MVLERLYLTAYYQQMLSKLKVCLCKNLRESVASDLEDLLNSRVAKLDELIDDFPLAKKSILQFGIIDFVGLSTANPSDQRQNLPVN